MRDHHDGDLDESKLVMKMVDVVQSSGMRRREMSKLVMGTRMMMYAAE